MFSVPRNTKNAWTAFVPHARPALDHHGRGLVGDQVQADPVAEAKDEVADRVRLRRTSRPQRRAEQFREEAALRCLPHGDQVSSLQVVTKRPGSRLGLFVVGERGPRPAYGVTPCMYAYCATVTPNDETISFVVPLTGSRCASPRLTRAA